MSEQSKRKTTLEVLKIAGEELTSSDVLKRFDFVIDYFKRSPRCTPDLDTFNRFINILWKKKNYDEALTAVEEAEKKYPGDRNLLEKGGEILIDSGSPGEALELFEELKELYPNRYQYLEYEAMIRHLMGELDQAEELYLDLLEKSFGDPAYLMSQFDLMEEIARINFEKGNYDRALEFLEEILTVHPRSSKWTLYFKALKKLGKEADLEQARTTYELIKKGRRYQSRASKYEIQKKLEPALKNYRRAIDSNPYEPQYYFSYGNILEALPEDEYEFQHEEATEYYKKAVELYPNNVFYLLGLVGNLTNTRDWDEAFEIAGEAGKKFPELMLPSLRYLSFVLGKEPEYMEQLRSCIEEDEARRFIELRTELAILLKERKKPEAERWFREAAELYLETIDYQPYNWRNYWDYANCMMEINESDKALVFMEKAGELHGEFSLDIAEKLMELYYYRDDFKKSKELLVKLIPRHSDDYEYYGKLGMCFLFECDYEKAFEAFNRSLTINRYIPENLYGAAVSAARLGNTEDAIAIIKDLLEMEPRFLDIIGKEDAFLEVKETMEFLQMLRLHKTGISTRQARPKIQMKKFILPRDKDGKQIELESFEGSKGKLKPSDSGETVDGEKSLKYEGVEE